MKGSVRKRNSGNWSYSFDIAPVDGKRKRIERIGGKTKKEALAAMHKAMAEYNNTGLHFEPSEISVSDYYDYWLKNYVELNCKYNTKQAYKIVVDKHIKPALGLYRLKALTPAVLQEFINSKHLSGLSKNYMKNILGVVTGSLKYAVHPCKFISDTPAQYIKLPKMDATKKEVDHKVITRDDFKRLIDRFPLGSSFYAPLMIAYFTGCRVGEVTALTWDRIDLDSKTIRVDRILINKESWHFGTPKTSGSTRTIAIGETLVNALKNVKRWQNETRLKCGEYYVKQYLDGDRIYKSDGNIETPHEQLEFVCTNDYGQLITPDSIKYCSRVARYDLGITFNFHSLRHTHATLLIEGGANMKDVQTRLGHSKLSTTMDTYAHATHKMKIDTVAIFESNF